jgi:hypothetical protein
MGVEDMPTRKKTRRIDGLLGTQNIQYIISHMISILQQSYWLAVISHSSLKPSFISNA